MRKGSLAITLILIGLLLGAVLLEVLVASYVIGGENPLRFLGAGSVVVVRLEGEIIAPTPLTRTLDRYSQIGNVKAVVLRIDSPGGGVAASQEIYAKLRQLREDGIYVVASLGSVAASGGYYVACAADSIVADPGTLTGSIGALVGVMNVEELLAKLGVQVDVIASAKYKAMGSPFKELSPDERKLFEDVLVDIHNQFVDAVAEGRRLPRESVEAIADGRVFTGRQALQLGLVDSLGGLDLAVSLAGDKAGLGPEPKVIFDRSNEIQRGFLGRAAAAFADELYRVAGRAEGLFLLR